MSSSPSKVSASSHSTNLSPRFAENVARSKVLSKLRSAKDLDRGGYCDPTDPCCQKRDPEIFVHGPMLQQLDQLRRQCPPKNPFHFEYTILHRLKLKQILQEKAASFLEGGEDTESIEKEDEFLKTAAVEYTSKNFPTVPPSSPEPAMIPEEDLRKSLEGIGNAALVHEIAINRDFKFTDPNQPINLQAAIALDGKARYWEKIDHVLNKNQLLLADVTDVIIDVFSTIKKMLLGTVLPQSFAMKYRVERELDMRKITKEINANILDFDQYMTFVMDILSSLCCAIRDKEIVEIRDMISDKVPFSRQAKRVVELMEAMNLDMTNFSIRQSRPHVIQNCVSFERKDFAKYIETQYLNGKDGIQMTRHWIISHYVPGRDFSDTMAHAFLELIDSESRDNHWPETLALDWFRFPPTRQEIHRAVIMGALVASVYDFVVDLNKSMPHSVENFEQNQSTMLKNLRLMSNLREELNSLLDCDDILDSEKLQKALSRCSDKANQIVDSHITSEQCEGLSATNKGLIAGLVESLTQKDHPGRMLYYGRVKEWFLQVMKAEGKGILQVPPNLYAIGPIILNPITEMSRIVMYNRAVFDILYEEIFTGNCPPPSFYPKTHSQKSAIVLDANNPKNDSNAAMDDGIRHVLRKLLDSRGRSMVYRRSHVNPDVQPMYNPDGTVILPPEQQEIPAPTVMSPQDQTIHDEHLLANEPTLDVDYEGIYDDNVNASDPNWLLNQTSEQIIRLMERNNIINSNKLRRIKKRIEEDLLKKRIADNLPVFEKVWKEDMDHLQKEFCRLERIHQKGPLPLPQNAQDEPSPKRVFPGTCELNRPPVKVEIPKYNAKGERILYSQNRGARFADSGTPQVIENEEYDLSRFRPDYEDEVGDDDNRR